MYILYRKQNEPDGGQVSSVPSQRQKLFLLDQQVVRLLEFLTRIIAVRVKELVMHKSTIKTDILSFVSDHV